MKRLSNLHFTGRGFGGIFRGLARLFKPLINFLSPTVKRAVQSQTGQKLLKQAKKSAVRAAISTSSDILNGENVKNSIGNNLKKASNDVLHNMTKIKSNKKRVKNKKLSKKQLFNFFE